MNMKQKIRDEGKTYFTMQVPDITQRLFTKVPEITGISKRPSWWRNRFLLSFSSVSVVAVSVVIVALVLLQTGPQYPGLKPLNKVSFSLMNSDERTEFAGENLISNQSIQDFALSSFLSLTSEEDNLVYSPISAYLALASLLEAADLDTYLELSDALNINQLSELQTIASSYMQLLNFEYTDVVNKQKQISKSLLSNGIFVNEAYPVQQTYLDSLATHYYSEVFHTPFSPLAKQGIAQWVNDKTQNFLDMSPDDIHFSADTIFTIYNTLYTKLFWHNAYKKANTVTRPFTNTLTNEVDDVAFMQKTFSPIYASKNADYDVVVDRIRYDLQMTIIMPNASLLVRDILENESAMEELFVVRETNHIDSLITMKLPKFSIKNRLNLKPMLQSIGVEAVFDSHNANLSKAIEGAFVSSIFQETGIEIEENGLEGASVTQIETSATATPSNDEILIYDMNRSFIYAISTTDGIPLYIGVNQSIN